MRKELTKEEVAQIAHQIVDRFPSELQLAVVEITVTLHQSQTATIEIHIRLGNQVVARAVFYSAEKVVSEDRNMHLDKIAERFEQDVKEYSQKNWNFGNIPMYYER